MFVMSVAAVCDKSQECKQNSFQVITTVTLVLSSAGSTPASFSLFQPPCSPSAQKGRSRTCGHREGRPVS